MRREIVTCEPGVFPLDWLPAEILGDLYIIRLSYFVGQDRHFAPVRYPAPIWTMPFRLVRSATRLSFNGLNSKVLAAARITAISVRSDAPKLGQILEGQTRVPFNPGHLVVLDLTLPDPPEAQQSLEAVPDSAK